jgi:hypothetical protein
MSFFNIKCNEAGHICDKSQYDEAGFWEILKLKIHHLYCKVCREHSKRNSLLTGLLKKSNIDFLDTAFKQEMEQKVQKELTKQQ